MTMAPHGDRVAGDPVVAGEGSGLWLMAVM